ncbi:MAG: hypothetical protein ACLQAH_02940 [Limisphaerales bacterium]
MAEVTLLCWENPGASELNLTKVVKFLGGTVKMVTLTGEMAGKPECLERLLPRCTRLMASAHTLAKLAGKAQRRTPWQLILGSQGRQVLVYGFDQNPDKVRLLKELTSDSLVGLEGIPSLGRRINVTQDFRAGCRQLSGLSFDSVSSDEQLTYVNGKEKGACMPIISLEQNALFVRAQAQDCLLFLLACRQIPDLDAPVPEGCSILNFFPGLVPVFMFLYSSSNDEFWHSDRSGACFILDDPLLKRRYGFLNYQKLLDLMDRKHFSTSIAFIPWNYRKSHPRVARLLASRPHAYSLCVHGCDHTRAEFGTTKKVVLEENASQALEWMRSHYRRSGVDFDNVMIFPQGIFSSAAMEALKSCGYLAAVNSTPYPIDARSEITLSDLLQVAITRFSNFPLFTRRYPQKLAELALDLFLGKPALVVEHHGFFRNGYEALADTVDKLYGMDNKLEWGNLDTICSRACLTRAAGNEDVRVLFFTNRFLLRNETDQPKNYFLTRARLCNEGIPEVFINGRPADACCEVDSLNLQWSLNPGQSAEIKIACGQSEPGFVSRRRDPLHQAKVFIRRNLSEFRDNYLDLNPLLSKAVRNRCQ